jgi:chromosome segregation protein
VAAEQAAEAAADREAEQDGSGGAEPEDDLGVEIEITPAGKSMKRLTLLSGGEKSMTAIAFLFSVFLARPCPFYILDEVEAALDDLNIGRFLDLLETYAGARSSSWSPTRSARWRRPTRCTASPWATTASPR